ncbi:MAG: threonine-phosphate decarboxylase CobD [Roseiarcus sp.]
MGDDEPFDAAWRALAYHGGDLGAAARLFPDAPEPWIDLSTGVNPHAYPLPRLARDQWARLPSPGDLAALERIAAHRYGARAESVIAAAGTQTLIQWLARLRPAARVGVLGFSYGGHAQAWRAAGARVETVADAADLAGFDVAIVVNPNNPDGRVVSRAALLDLHGALAARGGLLVVDEAFIDLAPAGRSLAPVLPARGAIVLRSFGKTYGLAGVRLGFGLASAELVAPLRAALGAWPVSGPALAIGRAALADEAWLARMRVRLAREGARLDRLLAAAGFEVIGGATLFRLVRRADARAAFAQLAGQGILTRPFEALPDRLRLGLPAGPAAWRRLAAGLRSLDAALDSRAPNGQKEPGARGAQCD